MESYDKIKKVLALGFMNFLDENRPKDKMCLSNGECADIEKAFNEQDWPRLAGYLDKYTESEDERIRKEIVGVIQKHYPNTPESYRWISWLEKQKVTPMPNSTELIEMWHKVKAILKEKDFRGDEWRLAQNAFMDGFARGTCVKSEKQKEQKPAEWSEDDKNMWTHLNGYLNGFSCSENAIKQMADWFYELPNRFNLQPKQEWSEEEKQKLNRIYVILGQAADTHAFSTTCRLIGDKEAVELQDFIRSIAKPQAQEWSGEDERILRGIIGKIDHDQTYGVSKDEMLNFLKKL